MKQILLVEDDSFLVDIYTTKLKEAGFSVEVALDGQDCLRKLQDMKPDLVILDIVLPQLDGWEILRKIKSQENLKNLKIVILSNLGQPDDVKRGVSLGVIKYFIKAHYTPAEVVDEIKKIISE